MALARVTVAGKIHLVVLTRTGPVPLPVDGPLAALEAECAVIRRKAVPDVNLDVNSAPDPYAAAARSPERRPGSRMRGDRTHRGCAPMEPPVIAPNAALPSKPS
jgi:hypothetical protein